MLAIGSQNVRLCDGFSRRDFLRIGALGTAGLALPQLLQAREQRPSILGGTFGQAKSCIVLFLIGGASQQDTFDLKPEAPAEVRGEFKPIATSVPGLQICEHLPLLARQADKCTLIRSVTHGINVHTQSALIMLTGEPTGALRAENDTREFPNDPPSFGSVLSCVRGSRSVLPPYVYCKMGYYVPPGRGAGWLGQKYAPFNIDTDPNAANFEIKALTPPREVPLDRLAGRQGLLDSINRQADALRQSGSANLMDVHYQKALDLITAPQARKAFDLSAEPAAVRDRYGRHTFGQAVLLARRLVEHGVSLVTVNWNNFANKGGRGHWDTHGDNFKELKELLLPPTDRAVAALLEDLATRGLLDETLVVCMGEFGRTPKINSGAGRDHWGACMSVLLAGGGIRAGRVYGSSDRQAAYPKDNPVQARDLVATIYHCLGIAPQTELHDQHGRPLRVCHGEPVMGLLGN